MEEKAEKSTSIPVEFCRLMRGLHSALLHWVFLGMYTGVLTPVSPSYAI